MLCSLRPGWFICSPPALSTLDEYLQVLRAADKEIVVNLDLFAGLSRGG